MIPLRDLNPTRTRPVVTWAIIALNVAVYVAQLGLGKAGETLALDWGVVPYSITHSPTLAALLTPVTSMFLHGGLLHLLGNMWFLHVFGDNVEAALGRVRYALFYLVAGLGAVALQVVIDPASKVPMIGASGAIAGVLGAYVMLYPRGRVLTLVPIVIFWQFMELPAYVFLFIWFGLQLVYGVLSLNAASGSAGVAFFAHIGGFAIGLALARLLRKRPSEEPEWRRGPWPGRPQQRF